MVDYGSLRRKFPVKNASRRGKAAAKRAIAREFEAKRIALGGGPPGARRGFPYYMAVVIGLLLVCGLAGSAIFKRGGIDVAGRNRGKAVASIRNLAVAAGRYRYHVGKFPTTEEGLAQLASKRVVARGWNGPYVKKINRDPWGNDYVYAYNGESETPTLYSAGPDGLAGTTDDIIADPADFDLAFRDTEWTKGWVPHHLRDIVVAMNETHKKALQAEVDAILHPKSPDDDPSSPLPGTLVAETLSATGSNAVMRVTYATRKGPVTNEFSVAEPRLWTPERPFLHKGLVGGRQYKYAIRTANVSNDGRLSLNGEPPTVRCVEIDPAVFSSGDGFDASAASRVLRELKDMGANAVRPSSPPRGGFREICDETGLLVLDGALSSAVADDSAAMDDVLDHMGFRRDGFWKRRTAWNRRDSTVKMLRAGTPGRFAVVSSGDEVEFFVDGESAGRRRRGAPGAWEWDAPDGFFEVKAMAYGNGRYLGEDSLKKPCGRFSAKLVADRESLAEGESAVIALEVIDEYGVADTSADGEAEFSLEGPGAFTAAGNADVRSPASGSGAKACLVNGRAAVVVRRDPAGSGLPLKITGAVRGLRKDALALPRR